MSTDTSSIAPADRLDPDVADAIGAMPFFGIDAELLPAIRQAPFPTVELSDAVERAERVVPGDPDVPVRVHRARDADGPQPCVYSMHGGGYVLGRNSMEDAMFDEWCPKLGVVGVSVDYRLAPESAYPGPLEDCYRGLKWTYDHADELGVDRDRIGVHGISAGGGLAAALALLARDRGEVPLAFQLLDSPMIDDRQVTHSSRQDGLPVWSRESNTFGWRSYLGELYGTDAIPYTAAAARAGDLSGLPSTFVSVGALDGFLDEDVDYALRLNRAGVPTELHVYPGACHGYQIAAQSDVARRSRHDREDWLARQLR